MPDKSGTHEGADGTHEGAGSVHDMADSVETSAGANMDTSDKENAKLDEAPQDANIREEDEGE